MRRGLNNENIMDEASLLVQEKGYDNFSLRELAHRLKVKPSSLYNHIKGIDAINLAVGIKAASALAKVMIDSQEDKPRNEAIICAARSYRSFALENPELYKAVMKLPRMADESAGQALHECFDVLKDCVGQFVKDETLKLHYYRSLRALLHGFSNLEDRGFMRLSSIPVNDSFEWAMTNFLEHLEKSADKEDTK